MFLSLSLRIHWEIYLKHKLDLYSQVKTLMTLDFTWQVSQSITELVILVSSDEKEAKAYLLFYKSYK